jgi:hypothetical protein
LAVCTTLRSFMFPPAPCAQTKSVWYPPLSAGSHTADVVSPPALTRHSTAPAARLLTRSDCRVGENRRQAGPLALMRNAAALLAKLCRFFPAMSARVVLTFRRIDVHRVDGTLCPPFATAAR